MQTIENNSSIWVRSEFLLPSVETEWAVLKQGNSRLRDLERACLSSKNVHFLPVGQLAEPVQLLLVSRPNSSRRNVRTDELSQVR